MIDNIYTPQTISIGRQGENEAQLLRFNCSEFQQAYGAGTAVIIHKRPGDIRPYIVPTTYDTSTNTVSWLVTNADTYRDGQGRAEIRWMVGEVLAKSAMFRTAIELSLVDETAEQPGKVVYMTAMDRDIIEELNEVKASVETKANQEEVETLKEDFVSLEDSLVGAGYVASDTEPESKDVMWVDTSDNTSDGAGYDDTEIRADVETLKEDIASLDLAYGDDGKVYISLNGVIVGNGIEISASTPAEMQEIVSYYRNAVKML